MLDEILAKINSKGWNVYQANHTDSVDRLVPYGPVDNLEIGGIYTTLPMTDDPTSWPQMQIAFGKMRQQQRSPIFPHPSSPIGLGLAWMEIEPDGIMLRAPVDVKMDYKTFFKQLDYLQTAPK